MESIKLERLKRELSMKLELVKKHQKIRCDLSVDVDVKPTSIAGSDVVVVA
jgi:hypothetical protein